MSIAQRRYNRRVLLLSILYAALLFAAVYLLEHRLVTGVMAYAVGVLPALAVSGFFVAIGRYIVEEQDEYLRVLLVRQILFATGIALTVATVWGFLEGFELVHHVVGYSWPIVWFAALGVGAIVNTLIERRTDG